MWLRAKTKSPNKKGHSPRSQENSMQVGVLWKMGHCYYLMLTPNQAGPHSMVTPDLACAMYRQTQVLSVLGIWVCTHMCVCGHTNSE